MSVASESVGAIAGVLTAIIGVAALAVIVSNNANTAGVIGAGGNFLSQSLSAAEAPVTGGGSFGPGYGGNYGMIP
ncbi:MAG: hypothetical protein ACYDBH_12280 [Acidobacteriaceae bacterium]